MVAFFNMFLSYLLLCVIFMAIIVCAVFLGKKLREIKDAKKAAEAPVLESSEKEEAKA
ncbi:MAG: hypothetical protein K6G83_07895 [Lachnospiraceae bacterium]|nr:hypothetical protein [Lachnospiraceae bacterium]